MHRYRAPSIAPGTFFVAQSWADFIINMSESNLRQAQEEWNAKRLQMVTEMLPGIRCLAYLRNPSNQAVMEFDDKNKSDGERLGMNFELIDAATLEQLDHVLEGSLGGGCKTALYVQLDGLFFARRAQIADFALRQKIALFAPFREDAEA